MSPFTYIHESIQLVEHEVKDLEVALEQVTMAIVEHHLHQHGKCLFLRHFL